MQQKQISDYTDIELVGIIKLQSNQVANLQNSIRSVEAELDRRVQKDIDNKKAEQEKVESNGHLKPQTT